MREKYQRCGMNSALSHSQEQPKHQEFVISACQTATHRKDAPCNQQDADKPLGAPVLRQMATRYLQRDVTPKENTGDRSRLLRVQMQVSADSRQGERNVCAIDKRDRVHDESHGYDANPSLRRTNSAHPG